MKMFDFILHSFLGTKFYFHVTNLQLRNFHVTNLQLRYFKMSDFDSYDLNQDFVCIYHYNMLCILSNPRKMEKITVWICNQDTQFNLKPRFLYKFFKTSG